MARTASYSVGLLVATTLAAVPAHARVVEPDSIADMSLEQLSDVIVTSVSRQQERLGSAAASVFIISASDIRRSGAQSLPEALRLAPNLQVAQVDARNWAISARGFNSPFANKLLVLIDGRSIYSPLFSGVFWDAQDVVLEDVERIEVISGPGATIWGANAVNGVINVITRSSADTQGGLLSYAGASRDQNGAARYGGALAGGGTYRVYGKYQQLDDTVTDSGRNTRTGMHRSQAGFRADWALGESSLSLFGDGYQGQLGQFAALPVHISGVNLQGRYIRKLSPESNLRLQLILDHTERNQPGQFAERLSTLDIEAQHDLRLNASNVLTWGGGYRQSRDKVDSLAGVAFLPDDVNLRWANLFAQEEYAVTPDLKLTAGAKVEHNDYTGAEYLPSLRLAWTPDPGQLLWSSLARTVRAPSRFDRDLYSPGAPVQMGGRRVYVVGASPGFESEVARVLELGYRAQPIASLSWSATAYYSRYSQLRTLEPQPRTAPALYVFDNGAEGSTRGIELWGRWLATPAWRLNAGLVVQRVQQRLLPGVRDAMPVFGLQPNDPSRHWLLRTSHDLSDRSTLELTLRYVSALPHPVVPAYYEMDGQWMWQPQPNLEVALIGRNLLHRSHPEFGALPNRSVIERGALLKLTWRF
ncbi:TonB-dependent receptor plug domain-containing protein [Duganella radicis]|uniref:TonB-dependent receptor plug domain-containing protein n=1 Tax=Duganella radicis TaxID=551988 RepID=A0A6L6PB60_9BURK|nr:TonB-dependent receptor [Duganella radicis]MTV36242.1 TonB-dependent receptor plug domain-containing protein [Duganella radicis]